MHARWHVGSLADARYSPERCARPGINGINGTNGVNGVNGTNGINGTDGRNGIDGVNGTNGIDGRNGTDGALLRCDRSAGICALTDLHACSRCCTPA